MAGLQDLLLLRQLQEQSDPVRTAFRSLAKGVSTGIEEAQAEQKKKRLAAEEADEGMKRAEDFQNTHGGKMEYIFKDGKQGVTVTPIESSTSKSSSTQLKAGQITGTIPSNNAEAVRILRQADLAKAKEEEMTAIGEAETAERKRIFTQANTIRDEFQASQTYKDFQAVMKASDRINTGYQLSIEAGKDPKTKSRVVADQALLVSIQKLLDETSVVRESEYARSEAGIALLSRVPGWIQKIKSGGTGLTDKERLSVKELADNLLASSKERLAKQAQVTRNLTRTFDLPEEAVFGGFESVFGIGDGGVRTTVSGNTARRVN